MDEYITKDAVISLFEKWSDGYAYIEIPVQDAIRQVSAIPPSDVRPVVRGQWERTSKSLMACSVCGNCVVDDRISGMSFCPHCGADMRGDEDG